MDIIFNFEEVCLEFIISESDFDVIYKTIKENDLLKNIDQIILENTLNVFLNENNFNNISRKKDYLMIFVGISNFFSLIIKFTRSNCTKVIETISKIIYFIVFSNIHLRYPKEIINLINSIQNIFSDIYHVFFERFGENSILFINSIDFYVILLNEEICSDDENILKLMDLIKIIMKKLYFFDDSVQ